MEIILQSRSDKVRPQGICDRCGKSTERHHTAKYCFECLYIVQSEQYEQYQKERKEAKNKRKEK